MRSAFVSGALVLLAVCASPAQADPAPAGVHPATANIIAGPTASAELIAAITESDRLLFDAAFNTCDADATAPLIAEGFEFVHDKGGTIATSREQFVESIREMCAGRLTGQNVMARRELDADTLRIYAVQADAAIEIGTHRFYGLEPGQAPVLRETGQFFHLWRLIDGEWRLARVFSYDHRPAN